jgi:hypothetical protein
MQSRGTFPQLTTKPAKGGKAPCGKSSGGKKR